ncbi:MAG: hypothetical protein RID09_22465 [Coleofasciculus sp. G1-WW12-02]|uniref:hypothetical protein n=1 Tax=unclassified Coleofasciculus TaxID=2692782 RepID=UPI0032F0FCE3
MKFAANGVAQKQHGGRGYNSNIFDVNVILNRLIYLYGIKLLNLLTIIIKALSKSYEFTQNRMHSSSFRVGKRNKAVNVYTIVD